MGYQSLPLRTTFFYLRIESIFDFSAHILGERKLRASVRIRRRKIAAAHLVFPPQGFQMISRIVIVIRRFLFIFVICFVLMFLFASLPVILVTAGILTLMQSFHWIFVNVGMNVIYKNDAGYEQAKKLGYDPFFDSLPTIINPNANRTCYILPFPEPEYGGAALANYVVSFLVYNSI